MKVYKIEQACEISERGVDWGKPQYSALRLIHPVLKKFDQKYSTEFFLEIHQTYYGGKSVSENWNFPEIEEFSFQKLPFPDISRIAGNPLVHIFSGEAIKLIGDIIINDGEFLDFKNEGKLFYSWFHILRNLNVIKTGDSMGFVNDPEYIPYLEKYEFYADKLEGVYLFHIVNHPGTFATGAFVDLVNKHDLKGLMFHLIWDSENPDYIDERFKPEVWAEIKARHAKRKT
jgi:hypothetical protein